MNAPLGTWNSKVWATFLLMFYANTEAADEANENETEAADDQNTGADGYFTTKSILKSC